MRPLFVLLIAFALSACASYIEASYTPQHSLTAADLEKSLVVLPGTEDLKGSSQFTGVKAKLENRLRAEGFTIVDGLSAADYVAFFTYGVDSGVEKKLPVSTTPGGPETETIYTRLVILVLVDRPAFEKGDIRKVYEAELTSRGRCGDVTQVMSGLLDALFKHFPGESGRPIRVVIPQDPKCVI